ncbi:MAG: ATP-binding protein [Comamonadaceae bacterium]|nr:ATP-binding protein [Comamonadaceae bacterium]
MAAVPHRMLAVEEASQVGAARRAAAEVALSLGFDEVDCGRVALAATELATNLVKHARGGRLLVAPVVAGAHAGVAPVVAGAHAGVAPVVAGAHAGVELLTTDAGPGIADVARAMVDGWSSAGTPGQGLGAVRRLAREFDLHTTADGSVVFARVAARAAAASPGSEADAYEVGAVRVAAPGETACGDAWTFAQHEGRAALMVADGLGHGPLAAEASDAAVAAFGRQALEPPESQLARVHAALRGGRGAAVAVASFGAGEPRLRFCGVGNIGARLVSGLSERSLLSQHGTAGLAVRTLLPFEIDWPERAVLVMHSDGIASRWSLADEPELLLRHPVVIAARLLARRLRGRDDATVVVVKPRIPPR